MIFKVEFKPVPKTVKTRVYPPKDNFSTSEDQVVCMVTVNDDPIGWIWSAKGGDFITWLCLDQPIKLSGYVANDKGLSYSNRSSTLGGAKRQTRNALNNVFNRVWDLEHKATQQREDGQ